MKSLGLGLALCALAANAMAAPAATPKMSRAVRQGFDAGFHDCADAMDKLVKFVHDDDEHYAYFGQWAVDHPNEESFSSITSEAFGDGKGITSFVATKNAHGKCSVAITQTIIIPATICATLRKDTFKDWKEYGDLNGDKIYEDPTSPNSDVILTPIAQSGCLVVKHIVSFGVEPSAGK